MVKRPTPPRWIVTLRGLEIFTLPRPHGPAVADRAEAELVLKDLVPAKWWPEVVMTEVNRDTERAPPMKEEIADAAE